MTRDDFNNLRKIKTTTDGDTKIEVTKADLAKEIDRFLSVNLLSELL